MKRELEKIAYMYGDMSLKKQRKKRHKLLIENLCVEYAKNSTLHGLRYVTERQLCAVEKVFWIVTFLASLGLCSFLIHNVYVKWTTSPVIVSIDEKLVSVESVPFPAVTICPQVKTRGITYQIQNRINDYRLAIENKTMADGIARELKDVGLICNNDIGKNLMMEDRNYTSDIYSSMDSHFLSAFTTIEKCFWQNSRLYYRITQTITSEGKCFTINGLDQSEIFRDTVLVLSDSLFGYSELIRGWSIAEGYSNSEKDPYPIRGNKNHAYPDLKLILHSQYANRDPLCNGLKTGYNVYLHHPADFPQASLYHYSAMDNQVTSLAVSVHVQSTADSLASYAPKVRQCYFPNERYLRFFRIYTTNNCELECLSNITHQLCDCVAFYMPHENGTKICAEKKIACMLNALNEVEERESMLELEQQGCHCLPLCYNVEYDAEVLKTDFVTDNYGGKERTHFMEHCTIEGGCYLKKGKTEQYNVSVIEVYFKKSQFLGFRRAELFGTTDFLANIGGLLGLFLGFSLLSLVEIFYYLTLKLTLMLKRDIEHEKIKKHNFANQAKY